MSLSLHWHPRGSRAEFTLIGDVRDVVNSRTGIPSYALPASKLGLGLISHPGSLSGGEGIVTRRWIGLTEPTDGAGVEVHWSEKDRGFSTAFFAGVNGPAAASGPFLSRCQLIDLYRQSFEFVDSRDSFRGAALIFLEIVAAVEVGQIQDRAVRRPTNSGNVLITSDALQDEYFKSGIISQFIQSHGLGLHSIPLMVCGVGLCRTSNEPGVAVLQDKVFYEPPSGVPPQVENEDLPEITSHSHAVAWAEQAFPRTPLIGASELPNEIEPFYDQQPRFLVHIDEWTQLHYGWVELRVARPI